MPPTVYVVGREEAQEILSQAPQEITALVSIRGLTDTRPSFLTHPPPWRTDLELVFDDVVLDAPLHGYVGVTVDQVAQIIAFGHQTAQQTGSVLVHCAAGVSRSTATAAVLARCWGASEQGALDTSYGAVKRAFERGWRDDLAWCPNERILLLADRVGHSDLLGVRAAMSPQAARQATMLRDLLPLEEP